MRETPLETSVKYTRGITWPASKDTVIQTMQRNGAPEDVLQALRSNPKTRFVANTDVHMILRAHA